MQNFVLKIKERVDVGELDFRGCCSRDVTFWEGTVFCEHKYRVCVNVFLKDFLISLPVARLRLFFFFRNPNRLKNQLGKLQIVSRLKPSVLSAASPSYILQYSKMASYPGLASCVMVFNETKSVVTVQRQFRE
jgi:hypothetical protein